MTNEYITLKIKKDTLLSALRFQVDDLKESYELAGNAGTEILIDDIDLESVLENIDYPEELDDQVRDALYYLWEEL